jgi:DHA1 family multidrug resistance protein-like MFS transporter
MSALLRDAPIGQIIRWTTNNRYFQYPEERDDFEIPVSYVRLQHVERKSIPTTLLVR